MYAYAAYMGSKRYKVIKSQCMANSLKIVKDICKRRKKRGPSRKTKLLILYFLSATSYFLLSPFSASAAVYVWRA